MNITDEKIENPNYISTAQIARAERNLKCNECQFSNLLSYEKTYFNWLLETDPSRCYWKPYGEWRQLSQDFDNELIVVRIDCEVVDEPQDIVDSKQDFRQELQALLGRHSIEHGSDTPDFILAEKIELYSRERELLRNVIGKAIIMQDADLIRYEESKYVRESRRSYMAELRELLKKVESI